MNYIDIFTLVALSLGFYRGYSKGLILEITSILAVSLGLYGSIKFSSYSIEIFNNYFPKLIENTDEKIISVFSFVGTFLVIIISISLIGKVLTKALKIIFLGFYNKVFGGVFGVLKFIIVLSILFVFFEKLNNQFDFTEVEVLNSSISFKKIKMLGELLFKMIIPEGYSINFFD